MSNTNEIIMFLGEKNVQWGHNSLKTLLWNKEEKLLTLKEAAIKPKSTKHKHNDTYYIFLKLS